MTLRLVAAALIVLATTLLGVAEATHTRGARIDRVNVSTASEQANAQPVGIT